MDHNPPTMSDLAYSAAQDAKEKQKTLEARIAALEQQVAHLMRRDTDKYGGWFVRGEGEGEQSALSSPSVPQEETVK